jgi:alkylated DNA repair dioxygenase AlkB
VLEWRVKQAKKSRQQWVAVDMNRCGALKWATQRVRYQAQTFQSRLGFFKQTVQEPHEEPTRF